MMYTQQNGMAKTIPFCEFLSFSITVQNQARKSKIIELLHLVMIYLALAGFYKVEVISTVETSVLEIVAVK